MHGCVSRFRIGPRINLKRESRSLAGSRLSAGIATLILFDLWQERWGEVTRLFRVSCIGFALACFAILTIMHDCNG